MRRTAQILAVAASTLVAGCASVPLPGGAGGGGYAVTIEFADVTDLVPYSTVKVSDVTVGRVEDVRLDDWTAVVTVRVDAEVELPANATARLRQTSLLGEKFVDLSAPLGEEPTGRLADGDLIPLARTDRGAEVEEVLGALALVLQGGGLDQLRTINTELVNLMDGREAELKTTLHDLDAFMTSLDEQRENIVTALEALDKLSADLADQRTEIAEALDAIAPGVTVLADQRELITDAVTALGELGDVGSHVIEQSGDETIAILQDLQPILENLVAAGDHFPQGLELAATYPFPHNATDAISNDFVNLHITLDLDLEAILGNVLGEKPIEYEDGEPVENPADPLGGLVEPIIGGLEELLGVGVSPDDATDGEED